METDKPIVAKATLLQMFKTENLRLNAFLCTVIWWALINAMMTCNFWWKAFEFSFSQRKHIDSMMGFMCYYGHVQNTSNLGEGNVYKSYFLGALVEIPCWSVIDIFIWSDMHLTLFICLLSQVCPIHNRQDGSTLAPSLPIHVLRHLWSCLRLHSWWPAKVEKLVILSTRRIIKY